MCCKCCMTAWVVTAPPLPGYGPAWRRNGALSLASGGADKFNGVLAQMVDSAGATDTAYQTMTDTFQHSMESLQTTAENLSIDLFEAMEPGLMEAANWGTDCLNTLTSALNESGPAAMLDAASGILEDLTAGVVQMIPGLASAATQVITKLVQYLADHQDEIFDAGIQLLKQLIIGITDNLPQLITAAAELIAKFSAALISHLPRSAELWRGPADHSGRRHSPQHREPGRSRHCLHRQAHRRVGRQYG